MCPSTKYPMPPEVTKFHQLFANVTDAVSGPPDRRVGRRGAGGLSAFDLSSAASFRPMKDLHVPMWRDFAEFSVCNALGAGGGGGGTGESGTDLVVTNCASALETFFHRSGPNPCLESATLCCTLGDALFRGGEETLRTVMSVMRQVKHRGRGLESVEGVLGVSERLGFPTYGLGEGYSGREQRYLPEGVDVFSMVPVCDFMDDPFTADMDRGYDVPTFCRRMRPNPTDGGVCQSFNARPVGEIFEPSPFTDAFESAFEEDLLGSEEELIDAVPFDEDTGLTLYLDRQANCFFFQSSLYV